MKKKKKGTESCIMSLLSLEFSYTIATHSLQLLTAFPIINQ